MPELKNGGLQQNGLPKIDRLGAHGTSSGLYSYLVMLQAPVINNFVQLGENPTIIVMQYVDAILLHIQIDGFNSVLCNF